MGAMSDPNAAARPREVTTAGVLALCGCVLLVVTLFDAMAQVRSSEVRDGIQQFLRTPPGDGLGVSVDTLVSVLRGVVLFNGAVAAAATVLAVFTFRRHRGARVGFTVAAAVLLFTAPVSGGFFPIVVAVAAAMLWTRPARDWFAGREPARRAGGTGSTGGTRPFGRPDPPSPSGGTGSAAAQAESPPPPSQPPPFPPTSPAGQPGGVAGAGYGTSSGAGADRRRPVAVVLAACLTWVFAGLALIFFGLLLLALTAASGPVLRALERSPDIASARVSQQELLAGLWVLGAVGTFWCLAALVLAFLVFRRSNAARFVLVVSAAISGLVAAVAFPVGVLHAMGAFTVLGLLLSRPVNAWFASRNGSPSPYGGHGGPSGQSEPGGRSGQSEPSGRSGQSGQSGQSEPRRDPPRNVW